jgi:hypothetical protein
LFVVVVLIVLGIELRASHLLGRWSMAWAMSPALFVIFQIGFHIFALAKMDYDPPTYGLLHSWDHRQIPPFQAQFLRWGPTNFLPDYPQTMILPIFASWVTGIVGVSHQTWKFSVFQDKCSYL